jgi:hypothetical protein
MLRGETPGVAAREEARIGSAVVANGNALVAEADDLDRVRMTAVSVGGVLMVTPMSGRGSAGGDAQDGHARLCGLHRSCTPFAF